VGARWGRRCQPIVFAATPSVPRRVDTQLALTVGQARALGVDVTMARSSAGGTVGWMPDRLFPSGQADATVRLVPIAAGCGRPPMASTGLEHIDVGWNARPAGQHEMLTSLEGTRCWRTLIAHTLRVRHPIRQLIGVAEGLMGVTAPGSGMEWGDWPVPVDALGQPDLAAIAAMAGCPIEPRSAPAAV